MTDDEQARADAAWEHYDESPHGREVARAAAEAVILHGFGAPPRGNEHLPPILSMIETSPTYDVAEDPTILARNRGGWCAPTEAERWQWLTNEERAAEITEARAAADRLGHDFIVVGGMTMPHPPTSFGGFIPLPMPTDGLIDLPAVRITVDTEAFQASMAEARERIGELGAALATVWDGVHARMGPAFFELGRVFSRITYLTPDGPPPPPIVNAHTALIALNWAEWTKVLNHPDKRTRRHAKARYLEVRRHLPRTHHRRLKSVPINQFGGLA